MSRLEELAARRRMLEARCQLQRDELAVSASGVAHSFRSVDNVVRVARRTAAHPLLLAGVVVIAMVTIRRRRLLPALSLGLSAAIAARRASALFHAGA